MKLYKKRPVIADDSTGHPKQTTRLFGLAAADDGSLCTGKSVCNIATLRRALNRDELLFNARRRKLAPTRLSERRKKTSGGESRPKVKKLRVHADLSARQVSGAGRAVLRRQQRGFLGGQLAAAHRGVDSPFLSSCVTVKVSGAVAGPAVAAAASTVSLVAIGSRRVVAFRWFRADGSEHGHALFVGAFFFFPPFFHPLSLARTSPSGDTPPPRTPPATTYTTRRAGRPT